MGWFSDLFKRPPKDAHYAKMLNGYTPIFTQDGTDIYSSDVVRQALKCIVDEVKKTRPTHVRAKGNDTIPIDGNIQAVLDDPNPIMTTSEFIEKTLTLLLLNLNVFIVPTYYTWTDAEGKNERRYYQSLYPIKPIQVDFIEDASGRLFVKFYFSTGEDTTIPYDNIIHVRLDYGMNDYMGGNAFGQVDNRPILDTLNLNRAMLQGIAKAMNSSYQVNGIVKYNTILDDGKMEANILELERKLNNSESGFLPLDLKAEFTQFPKNIQMVDEATLKFIDEKILRNWGVPLPILKGDYSQETYNAFYQKTLEPIIISLSQAFTKKMFTATEKSFGNRIEFFPKDLIFLSVQQTLEMINMLSPTGGLYENEKRVALGLRPLKELEGKRYMSLNWVDADMAAKYQMGKVGNVNIDIVDKNEDEVIMDE